MHLHSLVLFALLNVVAAVGPAIVASSVLPGSSVDLSCVIQEPCRRCEALNMAGAHCKTTGQFMMLGCSLEGVSSISQEQVKLLPWPLPHDATLLEQKGPQMTVALSCEIGDPLVSALPQASAAKPVLNGRGSQGSQGQQTLPNGSVDGGPREDGQGGALVSVARPAKVHVRGVYSRRMQTKKQVDAEEENSTHIEIKEVELTLAPLHMSLFNFELIMLGMLGVTLPVVYWRKIRVHYL